MQIKIRHRVLKSASYKGWHSFFLEVYRHGKYESRNLQVKANPADKFHYKEAVAYCEDEAAKERLRLSGGAKAIAHRTRREDFLKFFEQLASERTGMTRKAWMNALRHFKKYAPKGIAFEDVSEDWLSGLKGFLKKQVSSNSASYYFSKLITALREAAKRELIEHRILLNTKPIPLEETQVEYLTMEEVKALAMTPMKRTKLSAMRRVAFLFACFSGLRLGDVAALRWSQIKGSEVDGFALDFRQQKKRRQEYVPLPEQAVRFLEEAKELAQAQGFGTGAEDNIFHLESVKNINKWLKSWAKRAGISKNVHFHVSRHTAATQLLSAGAGLDATAEFLGHVDRRTTKRYAKFVPEALRREVMKMPTIEMRASVSKGREEKGLKKESEA